VFAGIELSKAHELFGVPEAAMSLTSPHAKRISGSKNFRSPSQKTFATLSARSWPCPAASA